MLGKDGDLHDELFDQSLIKLCDFAFLTGDKVLQHPDSLHGFLAAGLSKATFSFCSRVGRSRRNGIVVLFVVSLIYNRKNRVGWDKSYA